MSSSGSELTNTTGKIPVRIGDHKYADATAINVQTQGGLVPISIILITDYVLSNPSEVGSYYDGYVKNWLFIQDSHGSHKLSLDTKFVIPTSSSLTQPISEVHFYISNARTYLSAKYCAAVDKWDIIAFVPGY